MMPECPLYHQCLIFRRNIINVLSDDDLKTCRFDPYHPLHKFCPIFVLGEIAELAGQDYDELTGRVG